MSRLIHLVPAASRRRLAATRRWLSGLVLAGVMGSCGLAIAWTADMVRHDQFAPQVPGALVGVERTLPRPLRVDLHVVGADPEMQARIEQAVRGSGHVRIVRNGPADYGLQIHFLTHVDANGRERACSWGFAAVHPAQPDRLAFHEVRIGERSEVRAQCRLGIAAFAHAARSR